MPLYKLDLQTKVWSIVKTEGPKPPVAEEFIACVYKDKLYRHGGESVMVDAFLNSLWCFDFATCKWKQLSSTGSLERKLHSMFGYHDKLYIFGGVTYLSPEKKVKMHQRSLRAFQCFDLKDRKWETMRCVGDDPYDLSEYTMLPLCQGGEDSEPTSILVW